MLCLGMLLVQFAGMATAQSSDVLYRWRLVDYVFPNDTVRNESLASGAYIPTNNMPLGIQSWRDKLFITVPRWKLGVASTLNFIWKNDTSESPLLIPYPSWTATRMDSPDGIVNMYRTRIDECNRLWGLDTGTDNAYVNRTVIKPSRLIVIDLTTDTIIRIYPLKPTDLGPNSFIANLEVDTHPSSCDDAHVYLADIAESRLIVYNFALNDSWTIEHNFFYFDPLQGNYEVSGYNYQWTDGLFGFALSRLHSDGYKTLYFQPFSSTTLFSVSTSTVKNRTTSSAPDYYAFHILGFKGPATNSPVIRIDPITQIAYFPLVIQNAVGCWNTRSILSSDTFRVVWQDDFLLNYPNDMTLSDGQLCVLSDRLPILMFSTYDANEFNFYITCKSLVELSERCL